MCVNVFLYFEGFHCPIICPFNLSMSENDKVFVDKVLAWSKDLQMAKAML